MRRSHLKLVPPLRHWLDVQFEVSAIRLAAIEPSKLSPLGKSLRRDAIRYLEGK